MAASVDSPSPCPIVNLHQKANTIMTPDSPLRRAPKDYLAKLPRPKFCFNCLSQRLRGKIGHLLSTAPRYALAKELGGLPLASTRLGFSIPGRSLISLHGGSTTWCSIAAQQGRHVWNTFWSLISPWAPPSKPDARSRLVSRSENSWWGEPIPCRGSTRDEITHTVRRLNDGWPLATFGSWPRRRISLLILQSTSNCHSPPSYFLFQHVP